MWIEYLRIAWSVLRGNLFRSALTVASIVIGAFSIVLMTSLAESGLSTLSRSFEELGGSRLISVWRKNPEAMENKQASYSRGLTRLDPPAIKNIPHLLTTISFVSLRHRPLEADNGKRLRAAVVFPNYKNTLPADGPSKKVQGITDEQHAKLGDFVVWDAKSNSPKALTQLREDPPYRLLDFVVGKSARKGLKDQA